MKTTMLGLRIGALSACTFLSAATFSHAVDSGVATSAPPSAIPYVPTRHDTIRDLLWLADAGTNDVLYDLGSGDGRIVIAAVRDFGVRKAVGIEINPQLVRDSRASAVRAGVADRVEFIHGDLFTNDFRQASLVVLYLGHTPNLDLRAHLVRTLQPGARIVSHQFGMGEWSAAKTLDVRTALLGMYSEMHNPFANNPAVPDFATPFLRMNHDVLSVWLVPAPVAGIWRGKFQLGSREEEISFTLRQRLSGLTGSFQLAGATNLSGVIQADLWGSHLRVHCIPTNGPYGAFLVWFDGHATNDLLKGRLWISQAQSTREVEWTAHRNQADGTGTWQWIGAQGSPVQLKIQRSQGRLSATYMDNHHKDQKPNTSSSVAAPQPVTVSDLYDFGGGFYFTLLLGREGSSRRLGPEYGWLIGEAIVTDDNLSGTIAFYPYPGENQFVPGTAPPQQSGNNSVIQEGLRPWLARRAGQ